MLEDQSMNEPSITERLSELESQYNKLKEDFNEIVLHNDILSSKLTKIKKQLFKKFDNLEIEVVELNQYGRRECIEICNISENINQNKLETYVINFLKSLKVDVQSYDIVAVHRLGKYKHNKNRSVIVKFLNRKNAFITLKNRYLIKRSLQQYRNLYIIEHLCPYNKLIFNRLYKMKKLKQIYDVWTYNGSVFMNIREGAEDSIHIQLISDIDFFIQEDALLFSSESSEHEDNDSSDSTDSDKSP